MCPVSIDQDVLKVSGCPRARLIQGHPLPAHGSATNLYSTRTADSTANDSTVKPD